MNRTSCIAHAPKQAISIVRQDYYQLMEKDTCAAALLNIFEYWANAALAADPSVERPWVGARPIREFEQMLLGISTDKQIRKRLAQLEARGFIQVQMPTQRGAAKTYRVMVPELQQALVGQMTEASVGGRSNGFGQITEIVKGAWSNDPAGIGQTTEDPSVKQPKTLRSNDPALKKSSKEFKEEDQRRDALFCEKALFRQKGEDIAKQPIRIGSVRYQKPPESIDLAELWEINPGLAKQQLRAISPGHKRLEMVARGFGQWWVGPGINDFDEHLIQACRNRKRKFQQPSGVGDAKTYLNNMLRNGDWGNLTLRCEEANALRRRQSCSAPLRTQQLSKSPFERSEKERQDSALGLVRFKVSQGLLEQAAVICQQFGFPMTALTAKP